MSPDRSHAHVQVGHQLYPILEQCRKPEALWAKLATGNYDWLGVRRNGKYVLGRPRLSPVMPEEPAVSPDDTKDAHRVEFLSPLQRTPRWEACQTPRRPGKPSSGWWTAIRSPRCAARGYGGFGWYWTAGRWRSDSSSARFPR